MCRTFRNIFLQKAKGFPPQSLMQRESVLVPHESYVATQPSQKQGLYNGYLKNLSEILEIVTFGFV